MVNYEILNTNWRRERQSKALIDLDYDFFERARNYLKHLENQVNSENDPLIQDLFQIRYERASYIVNDLIDIRIEKHTREILTGEFYGNKEKKIPYEERNFRKELESLTTNFREAVLGIGDHEAEEEDENAFQLILMKKAEGSFVDTEIRTYGPLKPQDVVFLPKINAEPLTQKSKAEILKIDD